MNLPPQRIQRKLREVLNTREYEIPQGQSFGGTGAPGLYLEHLLDLRTSNVDVPDIAGWELKYTSGNSLITLFHKEAFPRGTIRYIINKWGWIGKNGRPSFRHTICGRSDRFKVVDDANSIRVRPHNEDDLVPHWPHNELLRAFARKLSHLILVRGSYQRKLRVVRYNSAEYLTNAQITDLIEAIVRGTICIDFDAYIKENNAIRNHGTKFRIKSDDLRTIYTDRMTVQI